MQQSVNPALVVAALLLANTSSIASNETIRESVDAPAGPAIGLSITRSKSRLIIQGHVSSTAHEALLRQTAARRFPGAGLEIDVQQHSPMPPGWSLVTDAILHAMADTHSSNAFIDERHIGIHGIVTNTIAWSLSVDRMNKSLLNGMQLELNVVPVENSARFRRLCENLITKALHNRHVEFRESSAKLRTNPLSLLDEIVEIATDCPTVSITVTALRETRILKNRPVCRYRSDNGKSSSRPRLSFNLESILVDAIVVPCQSQHSPPSRTR